MAAFGIEIFHLARNSKPLNALYIFVDFFLALSGFVLFDQIPKTYQISEMKKFMQKRINRIVPNAWFAVIITYLAYIFFAS